MLRMVWTAMRFSSRAWKYTGTPAGASKYADPSSSTGTSPTTTRAEICRATLTFG